MASAAEQLASSINFGAFAKATELKQRIWFTLGVLIVARHRRLYPAAGHRFGRLRGDLQQHSGGVLGMVDMFAGGAISRMTIFALGIMPYISASIIMQLLTSVSPTLEAWKKEGESGRRKINQYTRYGTVVLALVQSLRHRQRPAEHGRPQRRSAVIDPGFFFIITTVVTLTGGTMFLMWLGEQITARGIGNGISLIIFAGIVARLPSALGQMFEQLRAGSISRLLVIGIAVMRGRRHHLRRVLRARAAPPDRAISQATGRQPHVRRRILASAAEAQHARASSRRSSPSSLLLLPLTVASFYSATRPTCRSGCRR